MSKTQSNGTAVLAPVAKTATPSTDGKKNFAPITAPAPKVIEEEKSIPAFSDRMHTLNLLFALQSKHAKLSESNEKLKNFIIKGNESAGLELEDSEGNTFTTRNTEIIEEVVEFLKVKIATKCKTLEDQIKW